MSPSVRRIAPAVALGLALWALPPAAQAADPFYLDLLRDGTRALDDADHGEAKRLLRLACFGMLEEPILLADCLTRLALAEAASGEREAFVATYDRIAVLETRFQAYSQAGTPEPMRRAFADRAVDWVPARDLEAVASLAEALDRKLQSEVAALPAPQRRVRLGELILERPQEPIWPALLAELELAEGNTAAAATAATAVLALRPEDDRARCIQGRAEADLGQCEQALRSLESCPAPTVDPAAGIAAASCLATLERWDEAAAALSALPPGARATAPVRSLEKRVTREQQRAAAQAEREARRAAAEAARAQREAEKQARIEARAADQRPDREPPPVPVVSPTPAAETATPMANAGGQRPQGAERDAATTRASSLSADESATLDRARQLASRATVAAELEEPMRLARPIADRHPDDVEAQFVVAEVAYRSSDWDTAIAYFDRGGDPGLERPVLLFYQAVALYEGGQRDRAAEVLERSLPSLERDAWIESYVARILGDRARRP